jgi:hypothetical protein
MGEEISERREAKGDESKRRGVNRRLVAAADR